jgi:hypothetical protein
MRTIFFAVLLSLASGCSTFGDPIAPTRNDLSFTLSVLLFDSRAELVATCSKLGAWNGEAVEVVTGQRSPGCAQFFPAEKKCVVRTMRPQYVDDQPTAQIGHEIVHCYSGRYHD